MRKLYGGIVKSKVLVIILFLIAFAVCMVCSRMVAVNYDINDYLPSDTKSTVSIELLETEFSGGIPNARVMVTNVTVPQALEYKSRIAEIDGITAVTWLDDSVDITVPLVTYDQKTVETYYKDGSAVFTVTVHEDKRLEAVEAMREIIGDDNAMTGTAVSTAQSIANTVKEVLKVTAIAVAFALIVLVLTTTSWLEPVVVLCGIGVAVILNNGTNLLFGEVSFVTNAAGSVLQLAVSLDYSVFLLHRFNECRENNPDAKSAMVEALCKSTSSILSSGLTTVIGFLALVLMQFRIGADLGIALAKGIGISLITVFVFTPCLILSVYKLLDKTRHKKLMPSFKWFGKGVLKAAIPLVCVFVLVVAPAYLASNANNYLYGSSKIFGEDTEYGRNTAAIEEIFGKNDTYVLMVPVGSTPTEKALSDELHTLPDITDIISYVDTVGAEIPPAYLDEATLSQLRSENYSRMVLSVSVPAESGQTFELVENIRTIAEKYYPGTSYLAGGGVSTYDLKQTVTEDMTKVNLIAIGAVFIVLLISMRSLFLPVLLVLGIETAVWLNLTVPYFTDEPVFYLAYLIISSVQLGATVDYAILMTERYRENRSELTKKQATVKTVSDVFVSILTSGSVLTVVGFLMGALSSNQLLAQLGVFLGRGALFSLVIVLAVLPGLLCLSDKIIIRKKNTAEYRKADFQ